MADVDVAEKEAGANRPEPGPHSDRALDRLARMAPPSRSRPPRHGGPVPYLLAGVTVFNLWYLRDHVRAIHDLNDGAFHAAYVRWAADRISQGRTPFDGLFTQLGLGFPIFHHYQVLPHVIAGGLGALSDPALVYRWSLYLLLALWPLGLYAASRLLGLSRGAAVGAAAVAPFVVALPGYGYQRGSYTWQGYGMWSQLWGMWLIAFGIALAWRAIDQRRSLAFAVLVAAATITSHALSGYLLLAVIVSFALVATGPLLTRLGRAAAIVAGALAGSAWLLVPAFRDQAWTRSNLPPGTFWTDSYGAPKILGWLVSGELFDAGRWPVITLLAAVGAVVAIRRCRRDRALRAVLALTAVSLVLYFGRPTLGPVVDLLPAHEELFLHRMIVGVHLGGMLLAGLGLATLGQGALELMRRASVVLPRAAITIGTVGAVVLVLAPAWLDIRRADLDGATWMAEQRAAERTDGADFAALVRRSERDGGGRIYAGLTSNWGREYRIGYVPAALELTNLGADLIGFTGRIPALTEPSEARFDDTNRSSYELFGVRWALFPDTQRPPPGGRLVEARGRHRLYSVPGSGLLQVVDTTTPIAADPHSIDSAVGAFLRSSMAAEAEYPLLALPGRATPPPSVGAGTATGTSPGRVDVTYDLSREERVGAQVLATRPAAVVLKMSYHPRWTATVDGRRVDTILVAPGYLAVDVAAGRHNVEFHYEAISGSETAAWMALGGVGLVLLWAVDRRARRNAGGPGNDDDEAQPPVPGGAVSVPDGAVPAGSVPGSEGAVVT